MGLWPTGPLAHSLDLSKPVPQRAALPFPASSPEHQEIGWSDPYIFPDSNAYFLPPEPGRRPEETVAVRFDVLPYIMFW